MANHRRMWIRYVWLLDKLKLAAQATHILPTFAHIKFFDYHKNNLIYDFLKMLILLDSQKFFQLKMPISLRHYYAFFASA